MALAADWSVDDNGAGTAWVVGVPSLSVGTGPTSTPSGAQCAGTNLESNYTASASASLKTAAFTVPAVGATLSFQQFNDTEDPPSNDFGTVRLIDPTDGTPLEGGELFANVAGVYGDWSAQSVVLPAGFEGQSVRIEFRFTSDDTSEWAGFYIDDVLVMPN